MSRLLALDQSSHISGWAIFDQEKLIKYGKIEVNDEDLGLRLQKIRNQVFDLIKENEITEVVLEDIQLQTNVQNNIKTFKILAEVFGVIYELCTELNIPNAAVLASTWKSALNIKGRTRPEQKRNAQTYVANTYNVKAIQDVCDAICIGTCYLKATPVIEEENFNWE